VYASSRSNGIYALIAKDNVITSLYLQGRMRLLSIIEIIFKLLTTISIDYYKEDKFWSMDENTLSVFDSDK